MASAELQTVIGMMKAADPMASGDLMKIRAAMAAAPPYRQPDDITWEKVEADGVPAEWTSPTDAAPGRALVYFHGGGYATGSADLFRGLASHLARATRARVLNVDYRLGPEHRHPAAVEDAVAAYRFAVAQGHAPEHVALVGDSAGGGLVLATLLALRDAGRPLPGAAVAISPWTDLSLSGESLTTKADEDPMVRASILELMADAYVAKEDRLAPTASPLFGDVTGLPPVLIQVGSAELLLDDAKRFAEKLEAADGDVTLEVWEDMIHVWHSFADLLPEGRQAIERIGEYLEKRLA